MNLLTPINLKESILGYLDTLNKENLFEYYPATKGLTEQGKNINLGFSCYALKCMHILDNTSLLTQNNKKEWGRYINNYQKKTQRFANFSYIDENYLSSYDTTDTGKLIKDNIKKIINLLEPNRHDTLDKKLVNSIRAESKHAISTLSEIGQSSENKYLEFPYEGSNLNNFLQSLNWSKPWASGAQFASLCVFAKTQLLDLQFKDTQKIFSDFTSTIANPETGAYYKGITPSNQELINGSMKIISGLDWIDHPIHFPEKLIDLSLSVNPETEGCDLVDIVYVLYKCSQQSTHRKKEIDLFFSDMYSKIFRHFKSDDGGFSYFTRKSQTYYYGVKITEGLNTADIHGTTLLLWALSMIFTFKEDDSIKLNIIKP